MKRLAALVAAAAMVVGALLARGELSADTPGSSATPATTADPDRRLRIVCATELGDVCRSIEGHETVIEDPGDTITAIGEAEADWDLWVAPEVWPQIAKARYPDARLTLGTGLAWSELRVVARTTVTPPNGCVSAGCLLSIDGTRVGLAPPGTTAGVLAAAAIGAHVLGRDDYATNDLDDGLVSEALQELAATAGATANPITTLLTRQGSFHVAADLAPAVSDAALAAQRDRARAVDTEPAITERVVLAWRTSGPPDQLATAVRDALGRSGWQTSAAPPRRGLPNPAVIDQVARLWQEASST